MSIESQQGTEWDARSNCLWFEVDQGGESVRCCPVFVTRGEYRSAQIRVEQGESRS